MADVRERSGVRLYTSHAEDNVMERSHHSSHLISSHLTSSHVTPFDVNWVPCDSSRPRRTGSCAAKRATQFAVATTNHVALGSDETRSREMR